MTVSTGERMRGIEAAACAIREAYASTTPCAPVRSLLDDHSPATGYAVQRVLTDAWLVEGRRPVGHKIGLTSRVVQQQLGVDQPDYGLLFSDMAVLDGDAVPAGRLLQPRVEAEVAFVLERDLPHERNTVADVIAATAFVLPAIEIVDSRIAAWDITLVDTLADNASSGMFVLGTTPKRLYDVELPAVSMTITRGDDIVSSGTGAACLGSPVNAVAWLADTMAAGGSPLRAGDVVLSGALGPMVTATPGDRFDATIESVGRVAVSFAER